MRNEAQCGTGIKREAVAISGGATTTLTKNVIANRDGSRLYVTVGSNSNVAEHGMDKEEGRAAIWEIDARTGQHRVFAAGLRNPVGLAWEPETGVLWTVVNERDEIGNAIDGRRRQFERVVRHTRIDVLHAWAPDRPR